MSDKKKSSRKKATPTSDFSMCSLQGQTFQITVITDLPRLTTTTVVNPTEYPIREQMIELVKISNNDFSPYLSIDVGKVIGLYLSWEELLEGLDQAVQALEAEVRGDGENLYDSTVAARNLLHRYKKDQDV